MHYLGLFNQLLSTQNVNVARFARNIQCDFFCDFQTPCYNLPFVNRNISPMVFVAKSLSGWPLSPPTWPLFWSWRLAGRDIVVLLTMRPSILHCENHQIGPLKPPQSLLYQIITLPADFAWSHQQCRPCLDCSSLELFLARQVLFFCLHKGCLKRHVLLALG